MKIRRRGLFGDVAAYYVKSLVVCVRCTVQCETAVSLCSRSDFSVYFDVNFGVLLG